MTLPLPKTAAASGERAACPLCGAIVAERTPFGTAGVAVVRCSGCGLHYLSPRPTEETMAELYRDPAYFASVGQAGYGGNGNYAAQERSLRATFRRLLRVLEHRELTGGSLLEIGCGYGYFLDEAAEFFGERWGTDYARDAVDRAERLAERVICGGVESLPGDERFDCIVALHVIEHVYHPRAFLETLLRKLKPGGVCLLATPDMGGLWRRAMGARWPSFKFPEHVAFYDRRSLGRLMTEAGLVDATILPYWHAFPLNTVTSKLNLPPVPLIGGWNLWLPGTTVALAGRLPRRKTGRT